MSDRSDSMLPNVTDDGEASPGVIRGRFDCQKRLGAGEFGSVWLASDLDSNGVKVAVKLLHAKYRSDDEVMGRFAMEAEILSSLNHPSIARAIAWDVLCERPYLVMEYVEGSSLDQVIARCVVKKSDLARSEAVRLADELCGAVSYAHEKNVVHRDLKPKNIIIFQRANRLFVKVLDFGIAKILKDDRTQTRHGQIMGSLLYMAPEQIRGQSVTHSADIFALGTIFFEILTSKNPWARDEGDRPMPARAVKTDKSGGRNNDFGAMERIVQAPRPRASASRAGIPAILDECLIRAMAIEPKNRHASAEELGEDFKRGIEAWVGRAAPPSGMTAMTVPLEDGEEEPKGTHRGSRSSSDLARALSEGSGLEPQRNWGTGFSSTGSSTRREAEPEADSDGDEGDEENAPNRNTAVPGRATGNAVDRAGLKPSSSTSLRGRGRRDEEDDEEDEDDDEEDDDGQEDEEGDGSDDLVPPRRPGHGGSTPEKASRLPLIIAAVVVLVLVAGILTFVLLRQPEESERPIFVPAGSAPGR